MLSVKIITPIGLYKETKASIINMRTIDGQRGILVNHLPLVTTLEISVLEMEEETSRESYTIGGGVFYLDDNNNVSILVETIENTKDIDFDRAKIAKEKAEKILQDTNIDINEQKLAEIALKRAINRLSQGK